MIIKKDIRPWLDILFLYGAEGQNFMRLWRTNCRHGDFQTKFLKTEKCYDFNQLNLFHFFNQLLVSFGNVWKYLTLTGTIWAHTN